MSAMVLYKKNEQKIQYIGLKDDTGAYVNNATMTANMLDLQGNAITEITNLNMAYVAASNGNYEGVVAATFDPPAGVGYICIIEARVGGSLKKHIEKPVIVEVDTQ
jgi:hypothetical protein